MDASEFILYRGSKDEGLKRYKTLEGKKTSYFDYQLEINSQYTYGIQAISKSGEQSSIQKIEVKY